MYKYNEIKSVHLELTERCQAACPMCPRTGNTRLTNAELSLEDIKSIFNPEFIKQLDHINMCGNFGEPIVAKDCLEIIKYFRECSDTIFITMNTNAGARTPEWWTQLAKVIDNKGFVIFGIDGLEDTNHIYRVGVKYQNIINAAKAFIAAGGNAKWDFIVFAHNEHQVEEARSLSKEMGFIEFRVKKSYRYIYDKEKWNSKLAAPKNYVNKTAEEFKDLKNDPSFYDKATIDCKVLKRMEIFVSAEGLVFPCCWTAGQLYSTHIKDFSETQIVSQIIKNVDNINALKYGLENVMKLPYLDDIKDSWVKQSVSEGKLHICALTCNKTHDLFRSQYQ